MASPAKIGTKIINNPSVIRGQLILTTFHLSEQGYLSGIVKSSLKEIDTNISNQVHDTVFQIFIVPENQNQPTGIAKRAMASRIRARKIMQDFLTMLFETVTATRHCSI